MRIKYLLAGAILCSASASFAQNDAHQYAMDNMRKYYGQAMEYHGEQKRSAMKKLRSHFQEHPNRLVIDSTFVEGNKLLGLLTSKGTFSDMDRQEKELISTNGFNKAYNHTNNDTGGIFIGKAYGRIFQIASAYRMDGLKGCKKLPDKVLKAIIHYGNLEISRDNDKPRFHASCFAIPTAVANVYFALLQDMDKAETGHSSKLMKQACDMLKAVGLEAWTQPLRNDDTDHNVVSLDRFRKHVWWVGGNALGYRSLLPVAAMYSSVPMVDLLATISQKAISATSQTTYEESFWTEGFTADGAGWGHGKQCLVWGYPIDGASNAMKLLDTLNGTPWAQKLSRENVDALMNFFRGGNWYYYKGYRLPGLDRRSYEYNPTEKDIPYRKMLDNVISNWIESFSPAEQTELKQLQKEAHLRRIDMAGYPHGEYSGVRWFFNNDDLMKKTPQYHININMASFRTDGLESASYFDLYNFYPTDGATLFQREGNEYFRIMGGWDITAMPGVTAREGMDRLTPVTNWRGYCSKHNIVASATDDVENGVAGWIFEKIHGANKKNTNDKGDIKVKNEILYGFKAYKSYFIIRDYMIALGAGITNMRPEIEGNIRTTIDQTSLENEVYIEQNGNRQILKHGQYTLPADANNIAWLTQKGKFSYCLLPEYTSQAQVSLETKKTDWVKMNATNKKIKNLPSSVEVLRVWSDHGRKPADDKYGYVVYAGNDKPAAQLPFAVLQNDKLIQAVQTTDNNILQAMFYPGSQSLKTSEYTISVSSPCALMLEKKDGKTMLYVTDATMNPQLKHITVTINGEAHNVPMPEGLRCGDTGSLQIAL